MINQFYTRDRIKWTRIKPRAKLGQQLQKTQINVIDRENSKHFSLFPFLHIIGGMKV